MGAGNCLQKSPFPAPFGASSVLPEGESRAIELGREWMKKSLDSGHDYTHVCNVEEYALCSYLSLRDGGRIPDGLIDENLVRIAALWHDAFKATQGRPSLYNCLVEGIESSRIIRKQLKEFLSEERLNLVLDAVTFHNIPWLYPFRFLYPARLTMLGLILVEGDSLDSFNSKRFRVQWREHPGLFNRTTLIVVHTVKVLTMLTFLRSGYAVRTFWREIRNLMSPSGGAGSPPGGPANSL
ncbi:MAG: HD domain-containing protein [bacterium]